MHHPRVDAEAEVDLGEQRGPNQRLEIRKGKAREVLSLVGLALPG